MDGEVSNEIHGTLYVMNIFEVSKADQALSERGYHVPP